MEKRQTTERLLRAVDVSRILNCSKRSVHRYNSSNKIPAPVRISGAVRWKLSSINLFLQCNCDMAKFQAREQAQKCIETLNCTKDCTKNQAKASQNDGSAAFHSSPGMSLKEKANLIGHS